MLELFGWGMPVVYCLVFSIISHFFLKAKFFSTIFIVLFCGWGFCHGVIGVFTSTLKFSVGRFRPYFLQVCLPDPAVVASIQEEQKQKYGYTFATDFPCTGDKKAIDEARRCFPSGHSSLSLGAAAFCAFLCFRLAHSADAYVALQERKKTEEAGNARGTTNVETGTSYAAVPTDTEGESAPPPYRTAVFFYVLAAFCSLPPLIIGMAIAGSRVADNKHNLSDVIGGMSFGILSACIASFVVILGEYENRKALFRKNCE